MEKNEIVDKNGNFGGRMRQYLEGDRRKGEGGKRSRGFPVASSPEFCRSSDPEWESSEWVGVRKETGHLIGSGKWTAW